MTFFMFKTSMKGTLAWVRLWGMVCSLVMFVFPAYAITNLTFLVTADTHFGYYTDENLNIANIQAMNTIGAAASNTPRGVLVAGDLTENGYQSQWDLFQYHYPLNGGTGNDQIHYPVYECTGNHDRANKTVPVSGVKTRHGGLTYSWDWAGVHFISLDLYPSMSYSTWLADHLVNSGIASDTPIVIMTHYTYTSTYSNYWDDWDSESEAFLDVIDGYNVIALVHGHDHNSFHYTWEGYDVYNVGTPKTEGLQNNFGLVEIENNVFKWTEYYWTPEGDISVAWTDQKIITAPEPAVINLLGIGLLGALLRKKHHTSVSK